MTLSPEEKSILVNLLLEKADRNLTVVDSLMSQKLFDLAANRLYYSCFYAIQALLLNIGVSCHTHAGTITMFSNHFIKTGIFPIDFGKIVKRLEQLREKGDYNFVSDVEEEEVAVMVEPAHRFLVAVKEYLKTGGE